MATSTLVDMRTRCKKCNIVLAISQQKKYHDKKGNPICAGCYLKAQIKPSFVEWVKSLLHIC